MASRTSARLSLHRTEVLAVERKAFEALDAEGQGVLDRANREERKEAT